MPEDVQEKCIRYKRWQDRQACILVRELLNKLLIEFTGQDKEYLDLMQVDIHGKPFLPNGPFFNLSHTDGAVIVAVADVAVGIDIEAMKSVNLDDFNRFFTQKEQDQIKKAENGLHEFYKTWTAKEAIMKCDGRGLQIPLKQIITQDKSGFLNDQFYPLHTQLIAENFIYSVTSTKQFEPQMLHFK